MKQLYIIEYDSMHWCGGNLHCVAWADSEDDAQDKAHIHMEEAQRELFADEFADEDEDFDNECAYSVVSTELLEGSEFEEYYADPVQRLNFYPCVNPEDAV